MNDSLLYYGDYYNYYCYYRNAAFYLDNCAALVYLVAKIYLFSQSFITDCVKGSHSMMADGGRVESKKSNMCEEKDKRKQMCLLLPHAYRRSLC